MAVLEVAGELVGPVNDESKPLASVAPEQVPADANDVPVPPDIKAVFQLKCAEPLGGVLNLNQARLGFWEPSNIWGPVAKFFRPVCELREKAA